MNPHHERRWLILAVLCLAQLMVVLDATVVNIALPSAQKALHFSTANRQWIITAYALAFGSLLLLGGRISDVFGRKWTLIVGLCGFAIASAVGGAAPSFGVLVSARAAQGAFGALLAPAALSLMSTVFSDGTERTRAFGIYSAIAGGGSAVGLLLGGALTQYLTWRYCLYVNLLLAVPAAVGGVLLLVNQRPAVRARIDVPGALTVTGGLFALVYGVSNAETHGWGATATIAFLAVGAVLLAVFVAIERRSGHPLLPLRILRDRDRAASFTSVGLVSMGMFGVFLFLTYYLQQTLRFSPVTTGLAFLPMSAGVILAATLGGSLLLPRLGRKIIVATGMALGSAGMLLLTQIHVDSGYWLHVAPGLSLLGIGIGMVFSSAFNGGTLGVDPADSGVASATVNTSQQVGGSFGTALLSTLFATAVTGYITSKGHTPNVVAAAQVHGYTTAFWWSAAILAVGALIAGALYRPGHPRRAPARRPPSPIELGRRGAAERLKTRRSSRSSPQQRRGAHHDDQRREPSTDRCSIPLLASLLHGVVEGDRIHRDGSLERGERNRLHGHQRRRRRRDVGLDPRCRPPRSCRVRGPRQTPERCGR
jgi:EmrB/QacA subfamily drug resistance transporter